MPGRIKITPEQVRSAAREVDQIASAATSEVSRLQRRIESLQPDWEGMSKERFFGDYQQAKKYMGDYIQLLHDITKHLNAAAAKFEQTDQIRS